ncbi:MAG TPA: ROK family protein [Pirellulaceae bacterium]|nr:ROK family protein [Pirellulaceae bacterium]HMO90957.1 ROK family protein [Pirellulaceae bacterium]HMP69855.1 ROK family protein [Pirellulaceae bacterium]
MNNETTQKVTISKTTQLFAGIDVGGTNIKVGLASEAGEIISHTRFKTEQSQGPQRALQKAVDIIHESLSLAGLSGSNLLAAGIGTPGPLDLHTGRILNPSNLPAWHNFDVQKYLQDKIQCPVTFANDANAAAMGEYWIGSGQQYSSMVLLTLGTGVGGGIVIDNKLVEGAHSLGGECGHVCIEYGPEARICGCGVRGHLEAYASATAVVQRYCERMAIPRDDQRPSARKIAEAAASGEPVAQQLVLETSEFLARGIAIIGHVIDPQAIVLGGAMDFGGATSKLGQEFLETTKKFVKQMTFAPIGQNVTIEFARLGGAAGWIGAAALARLRHVNVE